MPDRAARRASAEMQPPNPSTEEQKENAAPPDNQKQREGAADESGVKDSQNSLGYLGRELSVDRAHDVMAQQDQQDDAATSCSAQPPEDEVPAQESAVVNVPTPTGPEPASEQLETVSEADEYVRASLNVCTDLTTDERYAYAQLVICVLKFDFLDNKPWNRDFCISTADTIVKRCNLPKKSSASLKSQLTSDDDMLPTDIVGDLMTALRSCHYLKHNGMHVLFADMISTFIGSGCYDSRHRSLMRHVCALLGVAWHDLLLLEDSVAHLLIEDNFEESHEATSKRKQMEKRKKYKRYALIGATGAVGGVLLGLTGGLAAPLVASGAGVVVGGAAAGIGTATGAAVIGTVFGVGGAGLAGYKMQKRVGAIEEFVVETLSDGQSLHCAVAVSGWIQEDHSEAFRWPWRHLRASNEQYTIRYESQYLLQVGRAMDYFMSMAVSMAVQQTLMETALAGLMSAIAWPVALLSVANVLDNPWNVCINRASEVGSHLANILLRRQHGQRPVTLLGFSLGARVIYHCLLEMSKRPQCYGVIQDVYLLGAPVTGSKSEWRAISKVVGGRIINAYCRKDWLLKFLYRTMSAQYSIAGVSPVRAGVDNLFNYDVSHIVNGHLDYRHKLREVLDSVGVQVSAHSSASMQQIADPDPAIRASQHKLSALATGDGGDSAPSTPAGEKADVSFATELPDIEEASPAARAAAEARTGVEVGADAVADHDAQDTFADAFDKRKDELQHRVVDNDDPPSKTTGKNKN